MHTDIRFQTASIFARVCPFVCVSFFSELAQQSQSHEVINLKSGLDFRLTLKTSLSTCINTHTYTVRLLNSSKTDYLVSAGYDAATVLYISLRTNIDPSV